MRVLIAISSLLLATACSTTEKSTTGRAEEQPFGEIDPAPATVTAADAGITVVDGPRELRIVDAMPPQGLADPWVPEAGDFVLRDSESDSSWNLRGEAFAGPHTGARLGRVAAFTVFWFAWSTAHDGGEVWRKDELNDVGPIVADASGDCNVPCDEILSGGPPPDGIPALDYKGRWGRPKPAPMVAADAPGADYLLERSRVLGVVIDGEARAYALGLLNWHENHIDRIGDTEFNMTYCPLTASGILIPTRQAVGELAFYVSGRLFNDNLTMFERDVPIGEATYWNQVLLRAIRGPLAGERLTILPVVDTTWQRWRQMYPDTLVSGDDTGYSRDYGASPYNAQQQPDAAPLIGASPQWADTYRNKDRVLAIDGPTTSRAYAYPELRKVGDRVVVNDFIDGIPLLIVYEREHDMALVFDRRVADGILNFEGVVAP